MQVPNGFPGDVALEDLEPALLNAKPGVPTSRSARAPASVCKLEPILWAWDRVVVRSWRQEQGRRSVVITPPAPHGGVLTKPGTSK